MGILTPDFPDITAAQAIQQAKQDAYVAALAAGVVPVFDENDLVDFTDSTNYVSGVVEASQIGGGSAGGGSARKFASGYHYTQSYTGTPAIVALSGNMRFGAFPVGEDVTFNQLMVYVGVANAGSSIIAGIYSDNSGYPGTLVTSATLNTAAATGEVSAVINVSLTAGLYWVGTMTLGAGGVLTALCMTGNSEYIGMFGSAGGAGIGNAYAAAPGGSVLPATFPASAGSTATTGTVVFLRAA